MPSAELEYKLIKPLFHLILDVDVSACFEDSFKDFFLFTSIAYILGRHGRPEL